MNPVRDRIEAKFIAQNHYPSACEFQPVTGPDGPAIGWTFRTTTTTHQYAWILRDGRVSPATEPYRSYAEQYALNNL